MGNSQGEWPAVELSVTGLRSAWGTLREGVGTGKVVEMRNALRGAFRKMSKGSLLAQLILLDEHGKIILALSSPAEDWPDEARRALERIASEVPGTVIGEDSFYRLILQGQYEGMVFACERVAPNPETTPQSLGGYYDVYELNTQAMQVEDVIGQPMFNRQYIDIPGMEAQPLEPVLPWFQRIVIIPSGWPQSDGMPTVSALIGFILRPTGELKEQLYRVRVIQPLLALFAQSAAFIFQTYALSQASAEEPERLYEWLSLVDRLEILREGADQYARSLGEADRHSLERLITRLLGLDNQFVVKRVLADFARHIKTEPPVEDLVRRQIATFVEAANPADQDSLAVVHEYVKAAYVPPMQRDPNEYWESTSKKVLSAAPRHVQCLYPYMDQGQLKTYLTQRVLPAVTSLLPGVPGSPIGWPLETQEELRQYDVALSALEDAYVHAESEVRGAICEALRATAMGAATNAEAKVHERLIASLMLIMKHTHDSERQAALMESILGLLVKVEESGVVLRLANRVFALLDPSHRYGILLDLRGAIPEQSRLIDQLVRIHMRMEKYEGGDAIREGIFAEANGKPGTELISVVSTKGGVGKTLIAVGLASVAAASKRKACLIDLDFFGPTVDWVMHDAVHPNHITLNEYLWARILPRVDSSTRREVFRGRRSWESYFEALSQREPAALLEDLLVRISPKVAPWGANMQAITCSRDAVLQDLMLPLLMNGEAMEPVRDELLQLSIALHNEGCHYVVFDTPAELKDLSMCAASLSTAYGGKNVFVSTLFQPSLSPLLSLLPLHFGTGENHLVLNKLRPLDQMYASGKDALIDYLSTIGPLRTDDLPIGYSTSVALLDALLCVEGENVSYIPWEESFDKFLVAPSFTQQHHEQLIRNLGTRLDPILAG